MPWKCPSIDINIFSCPGELKRWPCHSLTHWRLISAASEGDGNDNDNDNDYKDYNDYSDYRDSDLDLDWELQ